MRLNVKPYNCAGGQDFVIECAQSATVLDIKKRISEKVKDMPPETQKLVFRGRILSNSENTTSAGNMNTW